MEDFKVGDTVICNTSCPNYPQKGWKGKVIYIETGLYYSVIGVEWEKEFVWGHSCYGLGKSTNCRCYYKDFTCAESASLSILDKYQKGQLELEFFA